MRGMQTIRRPAFPLVRRVARGGVEPPTFRFSVQSPPDRSSTTRHFTVPAAMSWVRAVPGELQLLDSPLDNPDAGLQSRRGLRHQGRAEHEISGAGSGDARRTAPLRPTVDLERAEFEHTGTLLFCWPDGRPIPPETIIDWFTAHSIAAELPPIRLHDVRHSYATAALRAGVPVKVVSERLGHSTITITLDTYSHVLPGMQREAAEAVAALIQA